ncbi:hypothetical protein CBS101457_001121 [Exobasidium rhododendri]|nr:hypothetical protein CBS101457_001121 [Exobasidium rhododendri]
MMRVGTCRRMFSQNRPVGAISTTTNSSWKDPALEESQRQLELGTVALEAGNIGQAKGAYQRSIEIHETPSAHFNLGVCHYHEKNTDSAIEAWTNTIRLDPESADAHTNLASAYVMSTPSRPDLAVEHLKLAANITPGDPEVQYNLGAVLEACEQLEESVRAYDRALKGGIERAEENLRNVRAKILSIRLRPKLEELEGLEKEEKRKEQS